jgi:deoxyadenosine/deoxycytidine kinase
MIKILSRREYNRLKEAEEQERVAHSIIEDLFTWNTDLQAKRATDPAELEKYKKLYADELQKRLALAEKVAEIEKRGGLECS